MLKSCLPNTSALDCVKHRADTNKSVPLIPPNTEPPKGRQVRTSKIAVTTSAGVSYGQRARTCKLRRIPEPAAAIEANE
uniref:Uncharacterized protein n=1 Tax=Tanacetum cinerariifolium TaxID=118510 RepID=A0A699HK20_TANCI|nr:hypothetical protein [Tanacetum cinerariifolium]